ncbi:MAG: ADP-ribosylation factor-like protein [Candidatus Helarchaeota archaeon]
MNESILKVIFVGLDNSGKTSILYTLEGKFTKIASIRPTIRFTRTNFTILGLPIKIWDMGGQEQYRSEYLDQYQFFEGTDLLFYVIDIQDTNRFTDSVEYFLNILEVFERLNPLQYPPIIIFLHKADPYMVDLPDIQQKIRTLKSLFSDLAKSVDLTFFETSIYLKESLGQAFICGVLKILPKGAILQEVLADFMRKTDSAAIMLLDENVLLVAEAYTDEMSKKICRICGPYFANMAEKLRAYDLITPDTIEVEMQGWLFFKPIHYLNTHYYLVFFTKHKENFQKINQLLDAFTADIYNMIHYVL